MVVVVVVFGPCRGDVKLNDFAIWDERKVRKEKRGQLIKWPREMIFSPLTFFPFQFPRRERRPSFFSFSEPNNTQSNSFGNNLAPRETGQFNCF